MSLLRPSCFNACNIRMEQLLMEECYDTLDELSNIEKTEEKLNTVPLR